MNEQTKKILAIVGVILAVGVAGFSAMRAVGDPPLQKGVDNSMPPGSKTGKQMEMEAMQKGATGSDRSESLGGPE